MIKKKKCAAWWPSTATATRVSSSACVSVRPSPILFFFQAEDGIRAHCVTGVQTCALPISFDRFDQLAGAGAGFIFGGELDRSEEHTSELQSHSDLVCRLLLEKKKNKYANKELTIIVKKSETERKKI